MRCNKDCLNCRLSTCIHDLEDVEEYISDRQRKHKADYYWQHRAERIAKQKEYDKKHRTAEIWRNYYQKHKDEIKEKNHLRYAANREARIAQAKAYYQEHREEISQRRKKRRLAQKGEIKDGND